MDARFKHELKTWFAEVGVIYLIVVVLVCVIFVAKGIELMISSAPSPGGRIAAQHYPGPHGSVAHQ